MTGLSAAKVSPRNPTMIICATLNSRFAIGVAPMVTVGCGASVLVAMGVRVGAGTDVLVGTGGTVGDTIGEAAGEGAGEAPCCGLHAATRPANETAPSLKKSRRVTLVDTHLV